MMGGSHKSNDEEHRKKSSIEKSNATKSKKVASPKKSGKSRKERDKDGLDSNDKTKGATFAEIIDGMSRRLLEKQKTGRDTVDIGSLFDIVDGKHGRISEESSTESTSDSEDETSVRKRPKTFSK